MTWQPLRGRGEVVRDGSGESTAVVRLPFTLALEMPELEQETREEDLLDVPWQVVVHNDPVNLMSYVTMVFQKVFGFSPDRAEKHMLEVHREGRSIVWSGLRERAELYVQQLHGYLLLATIERAR
ncbi:ATP-dependent Clp protease adapter ClpS [soil metagenome]